MAEETQSQDGKRDAEMAVSKKYGGMMGLLVADAVGTPYEFKSPDKIPPFDQIDMEPPVGYKKSWSQFPTGIWSDDGSQALCLLEYYTEEGQSEAIWYDRWAMKLQRWYRGHLWVDNKSFDCGIQTQDAITNLNMGVHPLKAGKNDEWANGNGSLMRALPTALMKADLDDKAFFLEVENISMLTHPHARSRMACVLYCEIARELLKGTKPSVAIASADFKIRQHYVGELLTQYEILWAGQHLEPQGRGYVVDAFWSAIHCLLTTSTYEDCIKRCIELGNDTDTTAAIAGGLAGIIYGVEGIPQRWLDQLKGKDQIAHLLEVLK